MRERLPGTFFFFFCRGLLVSFHKGCLLKCFYIHLVSVRSHKSVKPGVAAEFMAPAWPLCRAKGKIVKLGRQHQVRQLSGAASLEAVPQCHCGLSFLPLSASPVPGSAPGAPKRVRWLRNVHAAELWGRVWKMGLGGRRDLSVQGACPGLSLSSAWLSVSLLISSV